MAIFSKAIASIISFIVPYKNLIIGGIGLLLTLGLGIFWNNYTTTKQDLSLYKELYESEKTNNESLNKKIKDQKLRHAEDIKALEDRQTHQLEANRNLSDQISRLKEVTRNEKSQPVGPGTTFAFKQLYENRKGGGD